jgi:hypothetical protein
MHVLTSKQYRKFPAVAKAQKNGGLQNYIPRKQRSFQDQVLFDINGKMKGNIR